MTIPAYWRHFVVFILLVSLSCHAIGSRFFDEETGEFDVSEHLLTHSGFLPVPIIITEPALGTGLGISAVYFDESISDRSKRLKNADHFSPPNITLAGGFRTENGSKGIFAGGFRTFRNDQYRYLGGLGKFSINLDYYGPLNRPRALNIDAIGTVQQLTSRIKNSNWMLGGRYVYFDTDIGFSASKPAFIDRRQLDLEIGRLGFLVNYDSRDNILSPSEGIFFEGEIAAARDWLGASVDFEDYAARIHAYMPVSEKLTLGLRGDLKASSDAAPFFFLPYINLRGIPAMRYQGEQVMVAETELNWQLKPRWSLLAFTGIGKTFGDNNPLIKSETVQNYGVGFRYLVASKLGLKVGVDVARGPEEDAIYLQVGSAWR
jgi:hypothetical protein